MNKKTVFKLKFLKKELILEKTYFPSNVIIPLGCDCHPANFLRKLNLRNHSFPFDWLSSRGIEGLNYVSDNLINDFKFFTFQLERNNRGYVVSKQYPNTEFMHEPDLIENENSRNKFIRRIERFGDVLKNEKCNFLYNISSFNCDSEERILFFSKSVENFLKLIKNNSKLYIYIRFDENFNENLFFCDKLKVELEKIKNVYVSKYIREKAKYGIWGDENKYPNLLKELGINLKIKYQLKIE